MSTNSDRAGEERLARTARRSAGNEAMLIWGLAGSALSVGLLLLDRPFPDATLSLTQWVVVGFAIGGALAFGWYRYAGRVIRQAQRDHHDLMKVKKAAVRKEHLAKMKRDQEPK